jgi:hypothetical protein
MRPRRLTAHCLSESGASLNSYSQAPGNLLSRPTAGYRLSLRDKDFPNTTDKEPSLMRGPAESLGDGRSRR